ncbi:MAG: DUF3501 family protein [Gammaproteobacteria bacterium]|nr:DUF3501 family protein [Gammaproteobacteria bacterium]
MNKLNRADLFTLEKYAELRSKFREHVMAHKRNRRLPIGPHAALYFEDRLTMQYQVQEMLRAERIFEAAAIDEELAAYNPLIPDGHNWKATFMIEYADEAERRRALTRMKGIETAVWLKVGGFDPIAPVADEDLEREDGEKTSAVHFLRFELSPPMIAALKRGAALHAGIDHPVYRHTVTPVAQGIRDSLVADLDG